jgi:hypothetical protein
MIREHEYCDCCDELVDPTNRFSFDSSPFDLPQAHEGESAVVCRACYNNMIDKALAQLATLKHTNTALLSRLKESK